jgi:hypothetical protein
VERRAIKPRRRKPNRPRSRRQLLLLHLEMMATMVEKAQKGLTPTSHTIQMKVKENKSKLRSPDGPATPQYR